MASEIGRPALLALGLLLLLLALAPATFFSNSTYVTGEVADATGPIANAVVRWQTRAGSTLTNGQGRFRLRMTIEPGNRITAWKAGYHIAGADAKTTPLSIYLESLPKVDNEEYGWVDPTPDKSRSQNCANCHAEIYDEWRQSGHARSTAGQHFQNLYSGTDAHGRPDRGWSLLAELGDGSGVCSSCHAPAVRPEEPAYYDLGKSRGAGLLGVHCDFCHKVTDVATEDFGFTHGRFGLKLLRPEHGQLFFGQLDDVDRGEDAYSPIYKESRYCASCHEGTVFGVRAYSTYSEWLQSPARRRGFQCQSCHMSPTDTRTNIAPGHGGLERSPATLSNHLFFQGSQAGMLQKALMLAWEVRATSDAVVVEISLEARHVGHGIPTGLPDRHVILMVEGLDQRGTPQPVLTGPIIPSFAGTLVGNRPGLLFAKQLSDFDGRQPVPFWRAKPEFLDSRLQPERPVSARFVFGQGIQGLRIRLLYRRFWEQTATEKGWQDTEIVLADKVFDLSSNRFSWQGALADLSRESRFVPQR